MAELRPTDFDVGVRYRSVRERLTHLLVGLAPEEWGRPVPATPGWCVKDVLAHLVGNLEDGRAGRINGPPSVAQTAEQVARHRGTGGSELLRAWSAYAVGAEASFSSSGAWPAFLDAVSHEHDVRAALGRAGAQDDRDVLVAARVLAGDPAPDRFDGESAGGPGSLTVVLDGSDPRLMPFAGLAEPLRLRVDSFTWLRLRLGRRTTDQMRALDWSGEPGAVLVGLTVFGPTRTPVD